MPPKKPVVVPEGGPRRSARNVDKPAPPPKAPRKKRSQEDVADDDEDSPKKPAKRARQTKSKKTIDDSGDEVDGDDVPEEAEQAEEGGEAPPAGIKSLQLGDVLPDLTLKNEKNEDIQVKDLAGDAQGVVFFLVPKANTPGCNTQACGYRDSFSGFKDAGYVVYCVSADSSKAQSNWQTKFTLPFPLLSDQKHTFIKALGAFKAPKSTVRSHFIFEKGTGKLVEKKLSVKPSDSPKDALKFIESHHGVSKPAEAEAAVPKEDAPVATEEAAEPKPDEAAPTDAAEERKTDEAAPAADAAEAPVESTSAEEVETETKTE